MYVACLDAPRCVSDGLHNQVCPTEGKCCAPQPASCRALDAIDVERFVIKLIHVRPARKNKTYFFLRRPYVFVFMQFDRSTLDAQRRIKL